MFILKDFLELIFFWLGAIEINGILQPSGNRVVSFFKDEPIAGLFKCIYLLISGYLLSKLKNKQLGIVIFFNNPCFIFFQLYSQGRDQIVLKLICIILFIDFLDFIKKLNIK